MTKVHDRNCTSWNRRLDGCGQVTAADFLFTRCSTTDHLWKSKTKLVTEHGGPLIRTPTLYFERSSVDSRPENGLSRQVSRNSPMKLSRYIKIGHGYLFFIQNYRWYLSYAVETEFMNRLREKTFCIEGKIRLSLQINQNVTVHKDAGLFLCQQWQSIFREEVIVPTRDRDWVKIIGKRKIMMRRERRFILGRKGHYIITRF